MKSFIYYNPERATVYIVKEVRDDLGERIGEVVAMPPNQPFLVSALLANAGHHNITNLTITDRLPDPPTT